MKLKPTNQSRRRHPNVGIDRREMNARTAGRMVHVAKTYQPVFSRDGRVEKFISLLGVTFRRTS